MRAFEYHRPSTTKDALGLGSQKSDGKYLAGGQSLVQAMKLRLASPSDLIDLGVLKELSFIKATGATPTSPIPPK
jgi:carbon-monoxide dehydrogenase medium subunit